MSAPEKVSTTRDGHVLERDRYHRYKCVAPDHAGAPCDGVVFRSVTTILGKAVPKGGLDWHGQNIGIQGCHTLASSGYDLTAHTPWEIGQEFKTRKLTVRDHMMRAADRGTAVHKGLEDYFDHGRMPVLADYPREHHGFVRGLAKFFTTYRPELVASEVQVLSVEHGFAGTFDLEAHIQARVEDVKGRLLLVPDTSSRLFILGDLKTSKYVYPTSHFAQLEAYEHARVENGRQPTEARAVLHVTADGFMQLVPSDFSFDDFLRLKASAEVVERGDRLGEALKREQRKVSR